MVILSMEEFVLLYKEKSEAIITTFNPKFNLLDIMTVIHRCNYLLPSNNRDSEVILPDIPLLQVFETTDEVIVEPLEEPSVADFASSFLSTRIGVSVIFFTVPPG